MGLDQYIYHIRKPRLTDKIFTSQEIFDMDLCKVPVETAHKEMSLYADIIPYATIRNVNIDYYDIEKIIADYNLPPGSNIGMSSYNGIVLSGYGANGDYVKSPMISHVEINDKYTYTKTIPCYIWEQDEVYYWRKNYCLQEWMDIENTGYRILDAEMIHKINDMFESDVPEENPTGDFALFYWEWY